MEANIQSRSFSENGLRKNVIEQGKKLTRGFYCLLQLLPASSFPFDIRLISEVNLAPQRFSWVKIVLFKKEQFKKDPSLQVCCCAALRNLAPTDMDPNVWQLAVLLSV
jgi:hypothetical protein